MSRTFIYIVGFSLMMMGMTSSSNAEETVYVHCDAVNAWCPGQEFSIKALGSTKKKFIGKCNGKDGNAGAKNMSCSNKGQVWISCTVPNECGDYSTGPCNCSCLTNNPDGVPPSSNVTVGVFCGPNN